MNYSGDKRALDSKRDCFTSPSTKLFDRLLQIALIDILEWIRRRAFNLVGIDLHG